MRHLYYRDGDAPMSSDEAAYDAEDPGHRQLHPHASHRDF